MEKDLMDKEVLCIIDTRQIQRYMFRSNTFLDTVGGSDLMVHVLDDAIRDAMVSIDTPLSEEEYSLSMEPDASAIPYFVLPKMKFQLIISTAGNALALVRTGALCQKIIRRISRYYLEHAYSLNLSAAVVLKTDNLGNDIFNLYTKLNNIKAASDISDPLGTLPVIMRERHTGEPVVLFDKDGGDYISRSSVIRRKEAKKRKDLFDIKEIRTTRIGGKTNYLAYIHADGNNLGITIGGILQKTPDYIQGIIARRMINQNIEQSYHKVMERTVKDLLDYYQKTGGPGKDFASEFQIIHRAGDDINIVCNADLAFPFIEFFYNNLKGINIWEKDGKQIPLYVCCGVSFVLASSTFHAAFNLAEECCKSAKTAAKEERNLRNGLAGNWIDFQICDNPNIQELDMLRERSYHTSEGIGLLLRPYSLDTEDRGKVFSYYALVDRVHSLRQLELPERLMNEFRQSYTMGRIEYALWIQKMKENGYDLAEILGEPLYADSDQELHAVWFDAVEILELMP